MTTTWIIQWLKASTQPINGFNEVVLDVGWACNGVDGTLTTSIYNTQTLVPPQQDDANFTPYANLTQDQVLGWLWAGGVDKTATEAAVASQLEALKNPPVIQPPLPWIV
jgi:hypothetical protein